MKTIIYIIIFLPLTIFSQTEISEYMYGQNAWMPDSIGDTKYYGKLDELWQKVEEANVKIIRVGGIAHDAHKMTNQQFLKLVDSIQNIGAEPLIQIPWNNGNYTSTEAANLVYYINVVNNKNVKFWSISNEPYLTFGSNEDTIANYFKEFASAMKLIDNNIKIVGPDLAWYNTSIMNSLLGGTNDITGVDANGNYYIDIISLHMYLFNGTQTRIQVVEKIQNYVKPIVETLISKMEYCDSLHSRGNDSLRWAFTEFNINYLNPTTNNIEGLGVNSFLNGQIWAEIFGLGMEKNAIFICPWSIHESAGNGSSTDFGFLGGNSLATYSFRPNFYHEQLLANNTKTYFENYSSNIPEIKTFGNYNNNLYTVVILNMSLQNYDYELFNNSSSSTTKPLQINATNINLANSYIDSIHSECTQLLVFNNQGEILYKYSYCLQDALLNLAPNKTILLHSNDTIDTTTCYIEDVEIVIDTLHNYLGGDSITTTITTLLPSSDTTIYKTTCIVGNEGTTIENHQNQFGCDSIVTIQTELLPTYDTTFIDISTNPADTGTVIQNFTTVDGCDSTFTVITKLITAIENVSNSKLEIFPNPTNKTITIKGENIDIENLQIYNSIGKNIIDEIEINIINKTQLEIDFLDFKAVFYIKNNKEVYKIVKL